MFLWGLLFSLLFLVRGVGGCVCVGGGGGRGLYPAAHTHTQNDLCISPETSVATQACSAQIFLSSGMLLTGH